MADKRRLNLSFSMASPFQREAWKRLCAIPSGQRTEAVCRAVCRVREQDSLLEAVRAAIREELALLLENEGYQVECAYDGAAAVERGIVHTESGPLVRSSYMADRLAPKMSRPLNTLTAQKG